MLVDKLVHFLSKKKAIWLVKLTDWRELVRSCVWSSVEFDGQVRSVFAEQFAVVVVDGPERREVTRAHGGEEVLPPATLQDHQALQAPLGVGSHHLQTVRDVRLVEDPSEEREERSEGDDRHSLYSIITASIKTSGSTVS